MALSRAVAAGALLAASSCSLFFDEGGLSDGGEAGAGGPAGASNAGQGGSGRAGGSSGFGSFGGFGGFGGFGSFPGLPDDAYGAIVLGDGPTAYYRFNDPPDSGGAVSAVRGAPDAEFVGLPALIKPGAVGAPDDSALRLGDTDFVEIDDSIGVEVEVGFAVELWFSLDASVPQNACLLSVGDDLDGGLLLTVASDPTGASLFARVFDEEGGGTELDVELASPPTNFTYLNASFDGLTLSLCVGEAGAPLFCTTSELPGAPLASGSTSTVYVGSSDILPGCALVGVIDELALYDRALDESEARAHHAIGSGELPPPF